MINFKGAVENIFDLVGNTPLISIPYSKNKSVQIFAKCEWYNPSGSVKDRAAANMIQRAMDLGGIGKKSLIDATSGNTGIAYALYGASLGIPVELALPENASKERKLILKNFGVKLHLTSALEGTDGAQRYVKDLTSANPNRYFFPDQYSNENNWKAHFDQTGPEILYQTQKAVSHFIAGLGTSGTFMGTSRFLKKYDVHCVSVQPNNPMHGLEGWKHMETAIVPQIYDESVAHDVMDVDTARSYQIAKAATKYLGFFLSPSSAANLDAAMRLADNLTHGCIVTIFPDNAMKYLDESFWMDNDFDIDNPF